MKSFVILISGRGSNMQALIEARLPIRIAAVISSRPDAAGLKIAKMHGIETKVLDQKRYADGLVYWCQENAWLDFHKSDGDLSPFATALPSSNLVCLKVADNAYITKGMTEALAKLLLDKEVVDRLALQAILKVRSIDSGKDKKRAAESHGSESHEASRERE